MPSGTNTGTHDIPLHFAKELSAIVNKEWNNGSFIEKVNSVTRDLLTFWFDQSFIDERTINFHEGQRQAILNTIYVHEVFKSDSVSEMYASISSNIGVQFIDSGFLYNIQKDKHIYPKYSDLS